MSKKFSDAVKMDIGLLPQAINNTNATGRYYDMSKYRRAITKLSGGAMAATKTTKVEFLQAKDAAGTGAKAVTGAEATITANTNVTVATLTCATVLATHTVTVNGLVFTAAAAADLPNRVFAVGANDTECAASLAEAINHAVAGVPGVTAEAAAAVVTLKATDPGEVLITAEGGQATITVATVQAQAYVELDVSQMDIAGGFTHLAPKVTTTANTVAGAELMRDLGRFTPAQQMGASKIL